MFANLPQVVRVQSEYVDNSAKGRRTLVDGAGHELAVVQPEKYHGLSPEALAHEIAFRLRLCAKLQAEHDALREVNDDLLAALEALVDISHGGTRGVQARDDRAVAARAAIAKAKTYI